MSQTPAASVIIPCLNEEDNLPGVLDALLAQDLPRASFEIVLVDGGSRDRSVEVAEERGVRVIASPRGVSVQRNRGAAEARAPVLVFLDADCLVQTDWLRLGLRQMEDAALAGGPILVPAGGSWVARAWGFHNSVRSRLLADVPGQVFRLIATANLFVRRDVFEHVGGFDESLSSGEDFFFCYQVDRLGKSVVFDDKVPVCHLGQPQTLRGFFREQVWHSNLEVWRRLRSGDGPKRGTSARRFGLVTAALLIALVVCGVVSAVFGTPWPLTGAGAAFLALPAALSFRTCARAGQWRPFIPLAAIYLVYGLARALYLLGLCRLGYRRS